jgi:hypothetical protein
LDAQDATSERLVCANCLGAPALAAAASAFELPGTCAYCGHEGACVDLPWLADHVHPEFEAHFDALGDGAPGAPDAVTGPEAVGAIAGLTRRAARDLWGVLASLYVSGRGDADDGHRYRERPDAASPALAEWPAFATALRRPTWTTTDAEALAALSWAFANVESLVTPRGRPVLRTLERGARLFRARAVERASGSSDAAAAAGPLQTAGVPVLLAAGDWATALAELRPARGQEVSVERLVLARPLRALALDAARKALASVSFFASDRPGAAARARFLAGLADALRRTPELDSGPDDWRATQRVCAWLAHGATPTLDALLLESGWEDGKRVIVFAPACATAALSVDRHRRFRVDGTRLRYRRREAPQASAQGVTRVREDVRREKGDHTDAGQDDELHGLLP